MKNLDEKLNSTFVCLAGGAGLGALVFGIPGSIIGGLSAGIFGWMTAKKSEDERDKDGGQGDYTDDK